MMGEAKVTVGGAVGYALTLLASHWRAVWGALALNALAATVTVAGQITQSLSLTLGGVVVGLVFGLMLQGAVFRLALADRHAEDPQFRPGQLGLQWRRLEGRMLLAMLLATIAFLFVAVLLALAVSAVLFAVLSARGVDVAATLAFPVDPARIDARVRTPLAIAQVAWMIPLLYVALRLALVLPATADRNAIQVFRTWRWTRGQVLRILLSHLMIFLPFLLMNSLAGNIVAGGQSVAPITAMMLALGLGIPTGALLAPLSAGLAAYFYRNLAPPPDARR